MGDTPMPQDERETLAAIYYMLEHMERDARRLGEVRVAEQFGRERAQIFNQLGREIERDAKEPDNG